MEAERKAIAGQILETLRVETGLSQKGLCAIVSDSGTPICERHYRRIIKGQMLPSVVLGMAICQVLDSSVYEVWG